MIPNGAILMSNSIWLNSQHYRISRRYINGIVLGELNGMHVAIHQSTIKRSKTLSPVVGGYQTDRGWVYPITIEKEMGFQAWQQELTAKSRLEWEARLQAYIKQKERVKVAIEDWSTEDLLLLKQLGWVVGFSAHAPLWRIYAQIPKDVWDGTGDVEMPVLDGQVRTLSRFGAILNLEQHRCRWR